MKFWYELVICIGTFSPIAFGGPLEFEKLNVSEPKEDFSIDSSVDPCHDFYAYACNTWNTNHPIPNGRNQWSVFEQLQNRYYGFVEDFMHEVDEMFNEGEESELHKLYGPSSPYRGAVNKMKLFYQSCMQFDKGGEKEAENVKVEVKRLGDTLKGFNVSNLEGRTRALVWGMELGASPLFGMTVEERQLKGYQLTLAAPSLTFVLPHRYEQTSPMTTSYQNLLEEIFRYLEYCGVSFLGKKKTQSPEQIAKIILEKETELARMLSPLAMPYENNQFPAGNLSTILSNVIDGQLFLQLLDSPKIVSVTARPLQFLKEINRNLLSWSTEDLEAFLMARVMVKLLSFQSIPDQQLQYRYQAMEQAVMGIQGLLPRQERCNMLTYLAFSALLSPFVSKKLFASTQIPPVGELITSIKSAYRYSLNQTTWIPFQLLEKSLEKLDKITVDIISYSPESMNVTKGEVMFAPFHVTESFLSNIQRGLKLLHLHQIKMLQPEFKQSPRLQKSPGDMGAYYFVANNGVILSLGMLQSPLYTPKAEDSANFGSLGSILAHEISHAFHSVHKFQSPPQEFVTEFKNRSKCLENQFDQFSVEAGNVSGKRTVFENFADLMGIHVAYRALATSSNLSERSKKSFFLSLAQSWCGQSSIQAQENQVYLDKHSPSRFRVNGPLSNLEAFSNVFQCPSSSPMNRKEKCKIWA